MLKERMTPFHALKGHQYMSLTTFRSHGEPVPTQVWFAQDGEKLYVITPAKAEMVKRIRRNAQVEVTPCTADGKLAGEPVEAMARVLASDQADGAKYALNQKYGWQKRIADFVKRLRGIDMVYLEIMPM
jgi:PPOX class probable F420-dependent enzyme